MGTPWNFFPNQTPTRSFRERQPARTSRIAEPARMARGTQAAVSSWKVTCVASAGAAASAFGTYARVSTAPPPSRPMAWGPQKNSVSSESRQTVW